jgi:hypothetical protein
MFGVHAMAGIHEAEKVARSKLLIRAFNGLK